MKTFNEFLLMTAGVPDLGTGTVAALIQAYKEGRISHGPLTVRRAVWFCRVAQDPTASRQLRADAREVLADCAYANGRQVAYVGSRQVVNRIGKASTVRLAYWAMDRATVW